MKLTHKVGKNQVIDENIASNPFKKRSEKIKSNTDGKLPRIKDY